MGEVNGKPQKDSVPYPHAPSMAQLYAAAESMLMALKILHAPEPCGAAQY